MSTENTSNTDKTVDELKKQEQAEKASRPGNEAWLISRRRRWLERAVLFLTGMIFAAAFPEMNIAILAWVALIPLYLIVKDKKPVAAWRGGFLWGYGWSITSFFWLREIEPFIPFLMAAVLALFPAFWAMLVPFLRRGLLVPVAVQLQGHQAEKEFKKTRPLMEVLLCLSLASWWCVTEWVRSWIATGLPWNLLGVTQWQNISLIQISEFTGVYGVSFIIAFLNISLALAFRGWVAGFKTATYKRPVPFVLSLILLMISVLIGYKSMIKFKKQEQRGLTYTVAVLQGDIPQCRAASNEQAAYALEQYLSLCELAAVTRPDLILWPETAVPYPFLANHPLCLDYRFKVNELINKYKIPIMLGTIDFGETVSGDTAKLPPVYNSAMLIDKDGKIADKYRKIHIVPFGEFVPFADYFPFLVDWIGMGRSLSAGNRFHAIEVAPGINAGVEICFEDIFPYVSRKQTLAGANLFLVITNDAWYPTSSEPEQHLANSVFRTIENRRPMIRCGNNSGSVLIQPNGIITDCVFIEPDPKTGGYTLHPEKRGRGCANFTVKVKRDPPLTFYTRYGNVFILICAIITGFGLLKALWAWREKKQALLNGFE